MFTTPQHTAFDWVRALERNREALRGIVATLFAMLAVVGEATEVRLSHAMHRAVLRVLRPAESAVRRLIVIAARGLLVKAVAPRPMPAMPVAKGGASRVTFRLFDPRKRFESLRQDVPPRFLPRIHVFGADPRVAALWAAAKVRRPAPSPDGLVNGQCIVRRLQALKAALDDLPHQARRLVRARARRAKVPSLKLKSPLRPGRPPGHRKVMSHEVDEILTECHGLACDVLRGDTS
jgi:hypothetical protein